MDIHSLSDLDHQISLHDNWRSKCLNVIASENVASPTVRRYLATDFGGRYPTYYDNPAERNYYGNRYMAQIEIATQNLAKRVYDANFVDFRPLGGEMAGDAVVLGLVERGDTIFETGDGYGGQKVASKLVAANALKDLFKVEYIPYDAVSHDIDIDHLSRLMREKKPKLVILGRAHILFQETIEPLRQVADEIGAYLAYDFSHVHGLIAGKALKNPLDQGVDVVMGSHHKTMPGPQGGIYMTRKEDIYQKVRRGLYPPLVTNHHFERIPALAATYLEMIEFGEAYAAQIVRNSGALGQALSNRGFDVLYPERGFSKTHQVLVNVNKFGGGRAVCDLLQTANIITGPGFLPVDLIENNKAASGIRLGTQELARIGMTEDHMNTVADLISSVLVAKEEPSAVAGKVADFISQFTELKFCFEENVHPYAPVFKEKFTLS